MSTDAQRKQWREQKRKQRSKNPDLQATKRREHYLLNRERLLERQRHYYYSVWKLKTAGLS